MVLIFQFLILSIFYNQGVKAETCSTDEIIVEARDDLDDLDLDEIAALENRIDNANELNNRDKKIRGKVNFFSNKQIDNITKRGKGKVSLKIGDKNYELEVVVERPKTQVINYIDEKGNVEAFVHTPPPILTINWPPELNSIDHRVELMQLYAKKVFGKDLELEPTKLEGGMRKLYRDKKSNMFYKCTKDFIPENFIKLAVRQSTNTAYVNNVVSKEIQAATGFKVHVKPHIASIFGLFGCEAQTPSSGQMGLLSRRKEINDSVLPVVEGQEHVPSEIDKYNARLKKINEIFNKHKTTIMAFNYTDDITKGVSKETVPFIMRYEFLNWHLSKLTSADILTPLFTPQGPAKVFPLMGYFESLPTVKIPKSNYKKLQKSVIEIQKQLDDPKSELFKIKSLFPKHRKINVDDLLEIKNIFSSQKKLLSTGKSQLQLTKEINNSMEIIKLHFKREYLVQVQKEILKKFNEVKNQISDLDKLAPTQEKSKAIAILNNKFLNYELEFKKIESKMVENRTQVRSLSYETSPESEAFVFQLYKTGMALREDQDFFPYYYGRLASEYDVSGALDTGRINFNTSIGLPTDLDNAFVIPDNVNRNDTFEFVDI